MKKSPCTIAQLRFCLLQSFYTQKVDLFNSERQASRFAQLFNTIGNETKPMIRNKKIDSPLSFDEIDTSDSSFNSKKTNNSVSPPLEKCSSPLLSNQLFTQNPKLQPKQFDLNLDSILNLADTRSTVMMKNLPNKFNTKSLVEILNEKFKGKYDVVYLPIDSKLKKNCGYAFINFTHCFHIIQFFNEFNGKKWETTNSKKVCEVTYSKVQGKEKMFKHYPVKALHIADWIN